MKVERKKVETRSRRARTGTVATSGRDMAPAISAQVDKVLQRLPEQPTRFVACAPGRLDVMGGLAEYTGSLVVNKTIGEHVCVAVQQCHEAVLSIEFIGSFGRDGQPPTVIAFSDLHGSDGAWIQAGQVSGLMEGAGMTWARCVVGSVVEMLRDGGVSPFDGGLSIGVGSTMGKTMGTGGDAALAAATLLAVSAAFDLTLDPLDGTALCQRVLNEWLLTPVGIGDGACVLIGKPNTLMASRCESGAPASSITLPDDLVVVGIDSGSVHPEDKLKYARVRTAAFMGRALIDRIVKHDGAGRLQWDGHLAQISAADYVERFRDRIPTKLKGSEYLERFGETGDPLTRIDPAFVYKVRSRTEHHIYEHARACQFVECLSRAIRNRDERALHSAGELMYASHWSYGQRCGLGSIETELLVNLVREHAAQGGIFGVKITARGCGGVVAVLMRAGEQGMAALGTVMERYQARTENTPALVRGSLPGVLLSGAQRL